MGGAEEFGPGATFDEEENAEDGGGDGEQVGEGAKLGGFEVAEEPEVEEVGERGAEDGGEGEAGPGEPWDGLPVGERAEGGGAGDGDGKNEEAAEEGVPGGHGEGVVLPCYALAEDNIEGER